MDPACDLTVCGDRYSRSPISRMVRWVDSSGNSRSSAVVSDEHPHGPATDPTDLGPQFLGLPGEDAQVGPPAENVPALLQDRLGAAGVIQRQVGMAHLHQHLHRTPGDRVGEQRPQASGPRQLLLGSRYIAPA